MTTRLRDAMPTSRVGHLSMGLSALFLATTCMVTSTPAEAASVPIRQQLAVPSYIHPNASPEDWGRLALSTPGSVGIAVANVINGPDYTPLPEWTSVIQAVHQSGVKVVGYVDTGYLGTTGQRTRLGSTRMEDWISQIQSDVAAWYAFYGDAVSGIFFDQGQNRCGAATDAEWAALYRGLSDEVHRLHPGSITILNPGIVVPQCYEHAADVLVTFEGSYASYTNDPAAPLQYQPLDWDPVDPMKIWHIVYDAATADQMTTAVALAKERGSGYVYVTDDVMPNPYDRLPASEYWVAEQAAAATLPQGELRPPTSPPSLDSVEHYATGLDIEWEPAVGHRAPVVAYDVYRDGWRIGSVPATTTSFHVPNLEPLTTYTFHVVARDALGLVSAPSPSLVETSDETYGLAPKTPTNVSASATGYTSTLLSWDQRGWQGTDRPPVESFVVLQNDRPVLRLPGWVRSVVVGKLAPGGSYRFAVVAIDATGGRSMPSSTVVIETPPLPDGRMIGQHAVTDTGDALSFQAEYLVPFAFRRVFLRTSDPLAPCWSTGSEPQMCADHVIENERLLRYIGNGMDWEWQVVRDVAPVVDGASYSWSIAPSDLGSPVTSVVFNANGYAPNSYCGPGFACTSTGAPLPYEW